MAMEQRGYTGARDRDERGNNAGNKSDAGKDTTSDAGKDTKSDAGKDTKSDTKSDAQKPAAAERDFIEFESLNMLEKSALASNIEQSIVRLRRPQRDEQLCALFGFCNWVCQQSGADALAVSPPDCYFSNLKYLLEHASEPGLYAEAGSQEHMETYYKATQHDVEIHYGAEDMDNAALASAMLKFTFDHFAFFPRNIFHGMRAAYRYGQNTEMVARRLPFAMVNRDVLQLIVGLVAAAHQQGPEAGEAAEKAWAEAVVHEKAKAKEEEMSEEQKRAVLRDLGHVEWERVAIEFFDR